MSDVLARNHVTVLGDGPRTVVFAHGFGCDQTTWSAQLDAFRGSRVVLFDHVGAGRSDLSAYSPKRYRALHSYATDLLEVLAAVDATDVSYVGHSMSGMIGVLAAQQEPERFREMVFLGASPRYLDDDGYVGGFSRSDVEALYAAMVTSFHAWTAGFSRAVAGSELGAAEFGRTLSAMRPDIACSVAKVIFESDHRADLAGHRTRTLLLQATEDPAVPGAVGRYLAAHMPNATLELVDAKGHFPHVAAHELVTRTLLRFLA